MKIFGQILAALLVAAAFGQDITTADTNLTVSDPGVSLTDQDVTRIDLNVTEETVVFDDEAIASDDTEDEEDLSPSEDVHSAMKSKLDLDNSLKTFVDSAKDFLHNTRHVFHQEVNNSKSENGAKDIWIGYSRSWQLVFDAVIKEAMSQMMSSEDGMDIDLSMDCIGSLMDVANGLKHQKSWAVELVDSSGRVFPEGSLDGTITSFGAYDECLAIERHPTDGEASDFVGQYCVVKYRLALPPRPGPLKLRSKVFNFSGTPVDGTFLDDFSHMAHSFYDRWGRTGVCIPSLCTQKEMNSLAKKMISERHFNVTVADCHTRDQPTLTTLQLAIVAVLSVILILMILATSLDLVILYTKDTTHSQFIRVESPTRKLLAATLLSFSVYSNGKNLFGQSHVAHSQIGCLNGIRVISMVWILWTHTYLIPIKETFTFVKEFMFTVEELGFQLILNGWVLVDTFFLVGAMLSTYSTLHRMTATDGKINIPQQILSRFFRIWPSLVTTVALMFLIPSLASGPLWREYFGIQLDKCHKNWWTSLIFINNWFDESQMCLLHTWYLSCDFQLFLLAFIFILPLYKKPSQGIKYITLTIAASALAIAVRTYLLHQNPTVLYNTPNERDVFDQASSIYVNTYIHLGPYFVGLILGYFVFKYKSLKINPLLNLSIWLLALFGCLAITLSTYTLNRGQQWNPYIGASYAGLHRIAWSLCVSWIIFGCSTGNGGPINAFLSWGFFVPMGKLSFMIYLMHFLVIWVRYAYGRQPLPFGHYTMFCQFIVNLVISSAVALVAHLAVEAPLLALYRIYLASRLKFLTMTVTRETDKQVQDIDEHLNDSGIIITSKL